MALFALAGVGHVLFHRARRRAQAGLEPKRVAAPVSGRWRAVNSPADRVPSHGTNMCAQTYAIDLVHEPEPLTPESRNPESRRPDTPGPETSGPVSPGSEPREPGTAMPEPRGERPAFGWWPLVRRPSAFPAFGAPVLAPDDGVVVHVSDGQRDHLSRNSWPAALLYLYPEGMVRQAFGARFLLGNHVVVDLGDGTYALAAHLRRGSAAVAVGDRVRTGEQLAECGNSGNSSEPHVHFQLMTGPNPRHAFGHPFEWTYHADAASRTGVPAGGELFTPVGSGVR
ncbi:M23 family metallopeptidase [Streptomyces sp. JJ66]|uniref:M23 family metallopeptidase n=1 Tax=Streptomyces sp. JJ66 TaxID=2803843 RepID=UPI001C578B49|nr:M23 family metallopeptidase [Streptomyces sp. JJ66]MBW1603846.1 M23 family metallopeptidase [Streptomyces sp. JJ66]